LYPTLKLLLFLCVLLLSNFGLCEYGNDTSVCSKRRNFLRCHRQKRTFGNIAFLSRQTLFDEKTELSFTIAAGPRQRSHSRVRVPWDSRPYFLFLILDFHFRPFIKLAGLRWRYSTPPPYGILFLFSTELFFITTLHEPNRKHHFLHSYCCVFTDPFLKNGFFCCCVCVHFRGNLFTQPLPSNKLFRLSAVMSQYMFDILCPKNNQSQLI
jgi:hypothetical protein